jgi:hypothetical protein
MRVRFWPDADRRCNERSTTLADCDQMSRRATDLVRLREGDLSSFKSWKQHWIATCDTWRDSHPAEIPSARPATRSPASSTGERQAQPPYRLG